MKPTDESVRLERVAETSPGASPEAPDSHILLEQEHHAFVWWKYSPRPACLIVCTDDLGTGRTYFT